MTYKLSIYVKWVHGRKKYRRQEMPRTHAALNPAATKRPKKTANIFVATKKKN